MKALTLWWFLLIETDLTMLIGQLRTPMQAFVELLRERVVP